MAGPLFARPPAPGEAAALASLARLVRRIAGRLSARCRCDADRDDVLSDAWTGALYAVRSYDPGKGTSLVTYAGRRITGEVLDGFRRRDHASKRHRERGGVPELLPLFDGVARALPDHGADPLARADDADHVGRLLSWLSPRDRLVLWRTLGEGLTHREAALLAGVSVGRVPQIVREGLALIRGATP